MADNIVSIASAVILDQKPQDTNIAPPKRHQSPSPSSDSKRVRLEEGDNSQSKKQRIQTDIQEGANISSNSGGNDERRRSSAVEEKKRGQRLFGGLLNALSQSTQNLPYKKRAEIHKRQLERNNTKKENKVPKCGQVTKLLAVQKQEQLKFDEESVEAIKREVSDFRQQFEKISELDEENKSDRVPEETTGEPQNVALNAKAHDTNDNTNNAPIPEKFDSKIKETEREKEEHNGEVMVENEEDTVIY